MDKFIVFFFSLFLLNSLASAQTASCTVYWGDTSCNVWVVGGESITWHTSLKESNATYSSRILLGNRSGTYCYAYYPKSKVIPCTSSQPRINGYNIRLETIDYPGSDNPAVARNLYLSTMLHLKFGIYGGEDKQLEYRIISEAPGIGTSGRWIRLVTTNHDSYDIDLAPLLNSSITGPLPTYPVTDFHGPWSGQPWGSIIRFRYRPKDASNEYWRYTPGVWLYYNNQPIDQVSSVIYGTSYGANGGVEFEQNCVKGSLSGIDIRSGSRVDSIKLNCHQSAGNSSIQYGGNGGSPSTSNCFANTPYVKGIRGRSGAAVDKLGLICTDSAKVVANNHVEHGGNGGNYFSYTCASGFSVKGLKGRSGSRLDNIRAICTNRTEDSGGE